MIRQNDKGGQVLIIAAERIAGPSAHAGESGALKASGLQVSGLTVNPGFSDEIMDEGQIIGHFSKRGYNIREMFAALTVPFEFEGRAHPRAEAVLECLHVFAKVTLFAMMPNECGLEIEGVQVASRASHKELDDPLGLGWVMKRAV